MQVYLAGLLIVYRIVFCQHRRAVGRALSKCINIERGSGAPLYLEPLFFDGSLFFDEVNIYHEAAAVSRAALLINLLTIMRKNNEKNKKIKKKRN